MIMVSGHAHGYERYENVCRGRQVQFIVSGGGGGPRPRLERPYFDDECLAMGHCDAYERPMHYLLLDQHDWGISIRARALGDTDPRQAFDTVHLSYSGKAFPEPLADAHTQRQANMFDLPPAIEPRPMP